MHRGNLQGIRYFKSSLPTRNNLIAELYDQSLELIWLTEAWPGEALGQCREHLCQASIPWSKPNRGFNGYDIDVLGSAAAASYTAPQGPSEKIYQQENAASKDYLAGLFGPTLDPLEKIHSLLGQLANGAEVCRPSLASGESFSPFNVRRLQQGQGIVAHVDTHFHLPIYQHLLNTLDFSTLISFFVVIQTAELGGELCIFNLYHNSPEVPLFNNGLVDTQALNRQFSPATIQALTGDFIVFAAGRCYHQVRPVMGDKERITLGGFAAFDKSWDKLYYWG